MESELDGAQQALATFVEAWQKAEEEASRLTNERVSLLVELGASKDELSTFRAKVSKEKKAYKVEFDAGFEVIFNYGYGCCAFAHNICGSKPRIPAGISDTSNPLPIEFFVNPQCPSGVVPIEATVVPEVVISEGVEHSSVVGGEVDDNLDSLPRVAGEREDPDASSGS